MFFLALIAASAPDIALRVGALYLAALTIPAAPRLILAHDAAADAGGKA
jgi:hypothetical protein